MASSLWGIAERKSAAQAGRRPRRRSGRRRTPSRRTRRRQRQPLGQAAAAGTKIIRSPARLGQCSTILRDTIVAVASAPGGAARGIVRLSGPDVPRLVARALARPEADAIADARRPMVRRGVAAAEPAGTRAAGPALFLANDVQLHAAAHRRAAHDRLAAAVGRGGRRVLPRREPGRPRRGNSPCVRFWPAASI